jgi:hypothetical protein
MRRGSNRGVLGLPGVIPSGPCRTVLAAFLLVLSTGCSDTVYLYKMYGGPVRPEAELAMVTLGDSTTFVVVGERKASRSDYGRLALLPGRYTIRWACLYGVSVLVEPSGWASGEGSGDVLLEAGHGYSTHCDRTTGPGYETFQWLKDDTTGTVVAGVRKP